PTEIDTLPLHDALPILVGYKAGGKEEVAQQEIHTPAVEVSTGTAQRKTVWLPDGTQVWLSPSTVLEYPSAFGGGTREVKLSGEADRKSTRLNSSHVKTS